MRVSVLCLVMAIVGSSSEAAEPRSVVELFNRVPELPATAEEAVRWFDQSGTLIHPGLLALKADIEAGKQAGGNAYMTKPFVIPDLRKQIAKLFLK